MNDEQELLRHFRKLVDSQDRAYVIQRAAFMADLQAKEKRSRFELVNREVNLSHLAPVYATEF